LRRDLLLAFRYLLAGSTAVAVNLVVLHVLTEWLHLYYVVSSATAFVASISLGFVLQKYWTFRDRSTELLRRQASLFFAVGLMNLLLGPALLYVAVEYVGLWYMAAQAMVLMLLAAESFLINRYVTFRNAS
jgi:putative flippase GtrA